MNKQEKEVVKRFTGLYVSSWILDDGNNKLLWKDKAPTPNEVIDFILKERKEAKEEALKEQKGNIEQAMVYFFRKLPDFIEPKRRMSTKRHNALWRLMCQWCDEYIESLKL